MFHAYLRAEPIMTPNTRNKPAGSGQGKSSRRDRDTASYEQRPGDTDVKGTPGSVRNPRQPHERDESARASSDRLKQDPPPSERQISDAAEDIERGLVDTDRRGIPNDVPKG
jgi:hypothetical protein